MAKTQPKLSNLKPRLSVTTSARLAVSTVADRRITGRALQARRERLWLERGQRCACCGRVVIHPYGYELDHVVPLYLGGEDTDENCQLLCAWRDDEGRQQGCHVDKTRQDAAGSIFRA